MTWQAIAEGANGIFYYSYFDLKAGLHGVSFEEAWERVRLAASEIKAHERILLSDPATCDWIDVPKGWSRRAWNDQGKTAVLIVNPTERSGEAKMLPKGCRSLLGPQPQKSSDGTWRIVLPAFCQALVAET